MSLKVLILMQLEKTLSFQNEFLIARRQTTWTWWTYSMCLADAWIDSPFETRRRSNRRWRTAVSTTLFQFPFILRLFLFYLRVGSKLDCSTYLALAQNLVLSLDKSQTQLNPTSAYNQTVNTVTAAVNTHSQRDSALKSTLRGHTAQSSHTRVPSCGS